MKLAQISQITSGRLTGDGELEIRAVRPLSEAGPEHIAHIEGKKYLEEARGSRAGAFLIPEGLETPFANTVAVADVKLALIAILKKMDPRRRPDGIVHPGALVDPQARLGANVTVYPGAVIMADAVIGDDSVIYPGAVIEWGAILGRGCRIYPNAVIGENCVLGADNIIYGGAVIGADGYGYYDKGGVCHKIPQIGIVRLGDRVEVGANVCIDRAMLDETTVGDDTKFDNLVQIGHNNHIGKNCYIVSQVGIAGSCSVGDGTILAGQVGVADHVHIGKGVFVGAQAGVPGDIADNARMWNTPCMPIMDAMRVNKVVRELPELAKKVKELEQRQA